jgi:hypothetical protein
MSNIDCVRPDEPCNVYSCCEFPPYEGPPDPPGTVRAYGECILDYQIPNCVQPAQYDGPQCPQNQTRDDCGVCRLEAELEQYNELCAHQCEEHIDFEVSAESCNIVVTTNELACDGVRVCVAAGRDVDWGQSVALATFSGLHSCDEYSAGQCDNVDPSVHTLDNWLCPGPTHGLDAPLPYPEDWEVIVSPGSIEWCRDISLAELNNQTCGNVSIDDSAEDRTVFEFDVYTYVLRDGLLGAPCAASCNATTHVTLDVLKTGTGSVHSRVQQRPPFTFDFTRSIPLGDDRMRFVFTTTTLAEDGLEFISLQNRDQSPPGVAELELTAGAGGWAPPCTEGPGPGQSPCTQLWTLTTTAPLPESLNSWTAYADLFFVYVAFPGSTGHVNMTVSTSPSRQFSGDVVLESHLSVDTLVYTDGEAMLEPCIEEVCDLRQCDRICVRAQICPTYEAFLNAARTCFRLDGQPGGPVLPADPSSPGSTGCLAGPAGTIQVAEMFTRAPSWASMGHDLVVLPRGPGDPKNVFVFCHNVFVSPDDEDQQIDFDWGSNLLPSGTAARRLLALPEDDTVAVAADEGEREAAGARTLQRYGGGGNDECCQVRSSGSYQYRKYDGDYDRDRRRDSDGHVGFRSAVWVMCAVIVVFFVGGAILFCISYPGPYPSTARYGAAEHSHLIVAAAPQAHTVVAVQPQQQQQQQQQQAQQSIQLHFGETANKWE